MPRSKPIADNTFTFRIDANLKAEFMHAAEEENRPVAQVLREIMLTYLERKRKKEFLAEARKQSLRIASSRKEKEVLDWLGKAADTEGWQ